jgi:hypothetical protein
MAADVCDTGTDGAGARLCLATSSDRINWHFSSGYLLDVGASGQWDDSVIYRSSTILDGTTLKIWYSARSTGAQWHVGYTEGKLSDFISPPTAPRWDQITGSVTAATDHPRSGKYGLKEVGGSTNPAVSKNITGRFSFNVWLYDDMSTAATQMAILRVWDSSSHSIGVGFYNGQSTTNYAYHTEGYRYTTTSIPRTSGWHKLSINIKQDTCDLLVDDSVVASLDVLDEANISSIALLGFMQGTSYFDDAYVRKYCYPQPSASVGAEERR